MFISRCVFVFVYGYAYVSVYKHVCLSIYRRAFIGFSNVFVFLSLSLSLHSHHCPPEGLQGCPASAARPPGRHSVKHGWNLRRSPLKRTVVRKGPLFRFHFLWQSVLSELFLKSEGAMVKTLCVKPSSPLTRVLYHPYYIVPSEGRLTMAQGSSWTFEEQGTRRTLIDI